MQRTGLTTFTLWRCFWRSLFLQAGYSTEGLQALGFAYALAPALARLYPDEQQRREAFARHLTPFNTHPYVAAAIVGGVISLEQRIAQGTANPDSVERFKSVLMGPLAALGDRFFWLSLRPAVGALSVALVPLIGLWAAVFYVAVYNAVHGAARIRLFWLGCTLGEGVVEQLKTWRLPTWSQRLRVVAAGAIGAGGAWLAERFGIQARGWLELVLGALSLGFLVLVVALRSKKANGYVLLYATAGLVLLLTALGVL